MQKENILTFQKLTNIWLLFVKLQYDKKNIKLQESGDLGVYPALYCHIQSANDV